MSEIEHVLSCHNEVGEGALWSSDEQALYWVDIPGKAFFRYDPATNAYERFDVGVQIGVMAERAAGGLVMAAQHGLALWDAERRALNYIAQPLRNERARFNDGAVDCAGRFWVGSMADVRSDLPEGGTLYRFDPDGSIHEMIHHVACANGIGWSPDNSLLYFTDSEAHCIYVYDFDPATGSIAHMRVLSDTTGQGDAVPDGLTVDSEGYIWSMQWDGAKILRYAPDGTVERSIDVPALRPTSSIFGGPDLTDLYITSASNFTGPDKERYPLSGDLFRLRTTIKGLPKYKFAG